MQKTSIMLVRVSQLGSDMTFELTGTQETNTEGTLNQKIKLDGAFNW